MRNLKCSLTELITSVSDQIKSRENADYYDLLEVSYSAPKNLSQPGRGRKRYEVTKDQLEHLRSLCFFFFWGGGRKLLEFFRLAFQPFEGDAKNFV